MGAEFICEACGVWTFDASVEEAPVPPVCFHCLWRRQGRTFDEGRGDREEGAA